MWLLQVVTGVELRGGFVLCTLSVFVSAMRSLENVGAVCSFIDGHNRPAFRLDFATSSAEFSCSTGAQASSIETPPSLPAFLLTRFPLCARPSVQHSIAESEQSKRLWLDLASSSSGHSNSQISSWMGSLDESQGGSLVADAESCS